MRLSNGLPVFSASDLTGFLACDHLLTLELAAASGRLRRPERTDPEIDLLAKHGMRHELQYLERLRAEGRTIVSIGADRDDLLTSGIERLMELNERTVAALREGPDVIYQGAFFDGRWQGFADFLLRVDRPSDLGPFSYEVADTKLARRVKAAALLQTSAYSAQLAAIQGLEPAAIHVVLGDRTQATYRYRDFDAYFRAVRAQFDEATARDDRDTYPERVEHCELCRWNETCLAQWRADDSLVFVAGLSRAQRAKLAGVGVTTLSALATTTQTHVKGIGDATLARITLQAQLQADQRATGRVTYRLLPADGPERGLASLPEPSEGDLFFDMEGDPLVEDGLEYLFGVAWREGGTVHYRSFWAHDRAEEKRAFEEFVDFVAERRARWPAMHVYHYAAYEESALKRLMGLHATREDAVDDLLRDGVLVDLYRVVRQGIAVSQESYSIKKLEPLYMPARSGTITDAGGSIVAYERWLEEQDPGILADIEAYNRDDCGSTLHLRDWLEERRREALRTGADVPRPPVPARPPESKLPPQDENAALVTALTDGETEPTRAAARSLLAQLLGYHRREKKSEWWEYFDRCAMNELELIEDGHAIGGLRPLGEAVKEGRSWCRSYTFPPDQEHRLKVGQAPHDPSSRKRAGEILELGAGIVRLKHGLTLSEPRALIPSVEFNDEVLREALRRLARSVIADGLDGPGSGRATRDILLRATPRLAGAPGAPLRRPNESAAEAARRLVLELDGGYLPIQGPPGTGKTFTGADMALDLVLARKKVGVVAHSHAVVGNFLDEICRRADARGVRVSIAHRGAADEGPRDPRVSRLESKAVADALAADVDVVGGTAWLFARPEMEGQLDVLFIDEAGQLALATALAVAGAARNVVLLGDPNQLAQPSRGAHPPGAAASVLGHVLGDRQTIPEEAGLFLDRTHRLRPEICAYTSASFYEDRLTALPTCSMRTLGDGWDGLRFEAVEHSGNKIESREEAERVRDLVSGLIGRTWADERGSRPLGLDDILIVAPYNAQVELLASHLPAGARVGTVDKFQGQQAPVAIFSMTSSTPEDAPRGMDFLYSRNRLNVAVSRAQALAIIVASPALLRVRCKTPAQMRLANALCLFAELAAAVAGPPSG